MNDCLFCSSDGPFTMPEHVIPEALGNDDLILQDEVCDKCNQYFGSKIEGFVLGKSPIAFWRTILGIRKKRRELPHIDLSQPRRQKGVLPAVHELHDNLVGFTCHDDYSVSVDIDHDEIVRSIRDGTRSQFAFVFTPLVLSMMGRFFCKIGVELVCLDDPERARSSAFDEARRFAREGKGYDLWPIFHGQSRTLNDLKTRSMDSKGVLESVFCYHCRLLEVGSAYTLLALTIGTDVWAVSLNDPYPTPIIREAVPDTTLELVWYSPQEVKGGPTPTG